MATGCGGHRAFVTIANPKPATMRFVDAVAGRADEPGLAPSAVVFLSSSHGFIATTGGGWEVPKSGWSAPSTVARIQETHDGGATWHTVWSRRDVVLQQLVFAGGRAFALGVRSPIGNWRDPSYPRATVAVASDDGGAHWRPAHAPAGFLTLTAAGSSWYAFGGGRLLRLDDPFGRWRRVVSPRGLGVRIPFGDGAVVAFRSRAVGFAAAACPGGQRLWRTDDAGRSWTPVPGTCGQPYSSLETDAHAFVAVQDAPPPASGRQYQLVRRSRDGGRTWPVVGKAIALPEITSTHFSDGAHGWAVDWLNSQGFFDSAVEITGDGGRTWVRRSLPAPPSAFAGRDEAWAVDGMNDVVWHTTDAARTWTAAASPRLVAVNAIVGATASRVVVATTLGTLASGASWHAARSPAGWRGGLARVTQAGRGWQMTLRVAGRRVTPPSALYTIGSAWFTDPRRGIVTDGDLSGADTRAKAWTTSDGGATWRRIPLPTGLDPADEAGLGANALAVSGADGLYVTADAGKHWTRLPLGSANTACSVSRPRKVIWVLCDRRLYRSGDDGRTWSAARNPSVLAYLTSTGDTTAWALGRSRDTFLNGFALWHTVDSGRTWRRVGVATRPTTPVPYRLPPYSMLP